MTSLCGVHVAKCGDLVSDEIVMKQGIVPGYILASALLYVFVSVLFSFPFLIILHVLLFFHLNFFSASSSSKFLSEYIITRNYPFHEQCRLRQSPYYFGYICKNEFWCNVLQPASCVNIFWERLEVYLFNYANWSGMAIGDHGQLTLFSVLPYLFHF